MILQLTLNYALVPEPKPRGRQKLKWIEMMKKTLNEQNISLDQSIEFANDRKE